MVKKPFSYFLNVTSIFQNVYSEIVDTAIFVVIWRFFDHKNHIFRYFMLKLAENAITAIFSLKYLQMCNFMVLYWPHLKILISGQVKGQNEPQNSNNPIYGHTFFGHNSAIFWPIGLNFLW